MQKSNTKKYIHIILCPKKDVFIRPYHASRLYTFVRDFIKHEGSLDIVVNGAPDHIHILIVLSENTSMHELVKKLKESIRQWLGNIDPDLYKNFEWKKGYAGFVARPPVMVTVQHIVNQDFHHNSRELSFDEELKSFFKYQRDTSAKDKFWWDDL